MRTTQPAAICLASLLVWACSDHHGSEHLHDSEADTQVAAEERHGLRLNGDAKWEMDDHTRTMFAAMVERLEVQSNETVAWKELGKGLESDLDALIQGCTMTGDAHSELHKFLVVYVPAVQELAEGNVDAVQDVKKLLALYPRYFK